MCVVRTPAPRCCLVLFLDDDWVLPPTCCSPLLFSVSAVQCSALGVYCCVATVEVVATLFLFLWAEGAALLLLTLFLRYV